MEAKDFNTEWCLLQNQFDSYEKHSLYIKLLSVIVMLAAQLSGVITVMIVLVLVVLWLQDAVWKTFQSRIEPRLLQVEACISEESTVGAFQFNREYQQVRLKGIALIGEYAHQALRPTVAFPHIILILMLSVQCMLYQGQ